MKNLRLKATPILALAFGLATGACAPPAGFVALSGLSYASSGKGISDHAISAVSEKDCAVLRAVRGGDICETRGNEDNGMLMTMIESTPGSRRAVTGAPVDQVEPPRAAPADQPQQTSSAPVSRESTAGIESIYSLKR